MKKVFYLILTAVISVFFLACNQPASTSENIKSDTTKSSTTDDESSLPAYDPAMDPLTVEGIYAKKLGDTLNIKMYEVTFKPGDSAMLHTHPDFTVYVLQGGKLAITPQGGSAQVNDLTTGMGIIFGSVTHSGKNVGNTTVKLLVHDIYRPRGK